MYRLLLHIGLPKTATSSLQDGVLMPWHAEGRVNFLGRCANDQEVLHFPFEPAFERIVEGRLGDEAIGALRPEVEALLDADRLNVLSEERFGGALGVRPGADAETVLRNLGALFRGDDVTVLVSLRAPVDFLLAAYVEQYHWRLHSVRRYRTLDRFLRELLRDGAGRAPWLVCDYGAWLRAVRRAFDKVEVLLYEDLTHDRAKYFARLAACLEAEPAELERAFAAVRSNEGVRTPAGKLSKPVTVRKRLRHALPPRVLRTGSAALAKLPPLRRLYRAAARTAWTTEHRFPDAATRDRLQRLLGARDDYLTREFGVSREKLARYGYLHPQAAAEGPSVGAPSVGARAFWPAAAGGGQKNAPAARPAPFDAAHRRPEGHRPSAGGRLPEASPQAGRKARAPAGAAPACAAPAGGGTTSLIVPTFNRPRDLARCLRAAERAAPGFDEILVVEQGDAERTRRIAERFESLPVTVLSHPQPSAAAARNAGIERARGDFLFLVDDDSELGPGCIAAARACFDRHPHAVGLTGPMAVPSRQPASALARAAFAVRRLWRAGLYRALLVSPLWRNRVLRSGAWGQRPASRRRRLHAVEWLHGGHCVLRRQVFDDGFRFNPDFVRWSYCEDVMLSYAVRKRYGPGSLLFVPDFRQVHHESPETSLSDDAAVRMIVVHRFAFWHAEVYRGSRLNFLCYLLGQVGLGAVLLHQSAGRRRQALRAAWTAWRFLLRHWRDVARGRIDYDRFIVDGAAPRRRDRRDRRDDRRRERRNPRPAGRRDRPTSSRGPGPATSEELSASAPAQGART